MKKKRTMLLVILFATILTSACAMKKPTTGLGQCKTQCSLDYPEKLTACRAYCECAYKGASVADRTKGSPKASVEKLCRATAKDSGVKIVD